MDCEHYEELFTGWINGELTPAGHEELENHLAGCAGCREKLADIQVIWAEMDLLEVPPPSEHFELKFRAMLDTFKTSEAEKRGVWDHVRNLWEWQPRLKIAYQAAIVLLSFGCGYWFLHNKTGDQNQELKALTSQVQELRQTMMLALLENPSASERMKAVGYTSEINNAEGQVIDALLATLNNDPNVNVRLSTLDALANLANYPEVREGMIRSIAGQESPLMQSAIADVMLKLQEKRAVGSFRKLLKQKGLDNGVRDKIKQTINSLI